MARNELSELAIELGLERAYELDPQAFAAARERARAIAERMPRPKSLADEPAHVFRAPDRAKREPEDVGSDL